jgi:hypothetical protein
LLLLRRVLPPEIVKQGFVSPRNLLGRLEGSEGILTAQYEKEVGMGGLEKTKSADESMLDDSKGSRPGKESRKIQAHE